MPKRMQNGDGAKKCFVFFEVKYIILMKKRTKHRYFCFVLKIYLLSGFLKLNTIASSLSNKYFESDVSVFIGSTSSGISSLK